MREKENLITRLLRFLKIIESKAVSKSEMCNSAQAICNHECDSCAWQEDRAAYASHGIVDELGGTHEDGVGVDPDGEFCGECSRTTCVGCMVLENKYNRNRGDTSGEIKT